MQFKNLTPSQIALINAFCLAFLVSIVNLVYLKDWKIALGSFVVLFGVAYLMINYFLQQFLYRRIKLIYKFIYQTKAGKKEETYYKYVLPRKSVDEVTKDVEKWASEKSNEIEILQRNEAYRKDFLQNLAHEFKTPVFAIQGYTDSLLDGAMEVPETRKKFLESTSRNVDRLVNLVNDPDEISRLESGEQPVSIEAFVIQDLIKEVYDSLSIKSRDKNIRCTIKKGCESPVLVYADKEKIRQVLINLVDNAFKYGRPNGNTIASIYKPDDNHALIEISDDGIGIEGEHLSRIFERFYRTDKARSRDRGGSGLGLAICKHIIEAHNQSIHVRSTPDIGTTIGFTLSRVRG